MDEAKNEAIEVEATEVAPTEEVVEEVATEGDEPEQA